MMDYSWMTDEMMGFCELKTDRLFSALTPEQYALYIQGAMKIGQQVYSRFMGKNLKEIMEKDGVSIAIRKEKQDGQFPQLQSQMIYEKKEKRLEIFEPVLREMVQTLQNIGFPIEYEQFADMHIAHEFYHFYEMSRDQRTGELLPAVHYKTFFLPARKGFIVSSSEIAAHYFTRLYCNLKFHPKILDYVYLLQCENSNEGSVVELFQTAQKMTDMFSGAANDRKREDA